MKPGALHQFTYEHVTLEPDWVAAQVVEALGLAA